MNVDSTDSSPSDNRAIEGQVQDVFGDAAVAREWLLAPNPALGHQTPMEALRTEAELARSRPFSSASNTAFTSEWSSTDPHTHHDFDAC
jgi:hypothetical protein